MQPVLILAEGIYHYIGKDCLGHTTKVYIVDWKEGEATIILREPIEAQGERLPYPIGSIHKVFVTPRSLQVLLERE